jgi:hypothetical protein
LIVNPPRQRGARSYFACFATRGKKLSQATLCKIESARQKPLSIRIGDQCFEPSFLDLSSLCADHPPDRGLVVRRWLLLKEIPCRSVGAELLLGGLAQDR